MTILFCFALMAEAKPFLGSKPIFIAQQKNFKLYQQGQNYFLIMGIGYDAANIATTWACTLIKENKIIVNIGCAGSGSLPLHQWNLVTQIFSPINERCIYPEILVKHGFNTVSLYTRTSPVTAFANELLLSLVDMEGFGVANAAMHFVAATNIIVFKWVSDNGDINFYKKEDWIKPYEQEVPQLTNYINEHVALLTQNKINYSLNNEHLIAAITAKMNITFTQKEQLHKALCFAHAYNKPIEKILNQVEPINIKLNRNEHFAQLLQELQNV